MIKNISIINWFFFVCFNNATKDNMLGSNILDRATIPALCLIFMSVMQLIVILSNIMFTSISLHRLFIFYEA